MAEIDFIAVVLPSLPPNTPFVQDFSPMLQPDSGAERQKILAHPDDAGAVGLVSAEFAA